MYAYIKVKMHDKNSIRIYKRNLKIQCYKKLKLHRKWYNILFRYTDE